MPDLKDNTDPAVKNSSLKNWTSNLKIYLGQSNT